MGQHRSWPGVATATVSVMFLAAGDPVISVDTREKELGCEYANEGRDQVPASISTAGANCSQNAALRVT